MIRFNQLEGNDIFVKNNSGTRRSEKFNRFSQALRKVPFLLEERMPRGIYIRTKPSHNKGKHIWKNKPHPKGMLGKTPWNKGKKLGFIPEYAFKKGCIPWNRNGDGKHKSGGGYIYILKPNHPSINNQGYIPEHRFIMEKYLGRNLLSEERIHHLNGVVSDNRIENLQLFANQAKHSSIHYKNMRIDEKGRFIKKEKYGR